MKNKIIFWSKGEKFLETKEDILKLVDSLKVQLDFLYELRVEDLLEFFEKLSDHWRDKGVLGVDKGLLRNLSEFIKKDNLIQMLNFSLRGDYEILDKFIKIEGGEEGYEYTCHAKGLVVHWLAGNVPVLGLYPIIQSIVTKNVSLVKAPSQGYKELLALLESFKDVETEKIKGSELLKGICVVLVDKNSKELQNAMSEIADVRAAWGGKEAIEAISSLKKKMFSEDVIFGPKYSYGVVDKESLEEIEGIVKRLAFDVCVFDQYACSSPHTIFVQENKKGDALKFAEGLGRAMDFISKKMIKKGETEPGKKMDILSVRAKYSMIGKVFQSEGHDWTVVYTEEEGFEEPCFSRVVFVKPIKNLLELMGLNTQKMQTLGCAVKGKRDELRRITRKGVDRCVKFGNMGRIFSNG